MAAGAAGGGAGRSKALRPRSARQRRGGHSMQASGLHAAIRTY